jgi:hypothetical protein
MKKLLFDLRGAFLNGGLLSKLRRQQYVCCLEWEQVERDMKFFWRQNQKIMRSMDAQGSKKRLSGRIFRSRNEEDMVTERENRLANKSSTYSRGNVGKKRNLERFRQILTRYSKKKYVSPQTIEGWA